LENVRWWVPAVGTIALANLFWFVAFSVDWGSFWVKISLSAAVLAFISIRFQRQETGLWRYDGRTILLGSACAVVLYVLFLVAKVFFTTLVPFAQDQIGRIYAEGQGTPLWLMIVLALFVTGPSEEYYWRGFVQRRLMDRWGSWQGWFVATALYAGVHVWSFNVVLIGAAWVAGAFWGAMYWRVGRLLPVIICHSVWSVLALVLLPFA
jgi:membrane protease YdiL (CAAX protease family)